MVMVPVYNSACLDIIISPPTGHQRNNTFLHTRTTKWLTYIMLYHVSTRWDCSETGHLNMTSMLWTVVSDKGISRMDEDKQFRLQTKQNIVLKIFFLLKLGCYVI